MVDKFMVRVDQIITSACFEPPDNEGERLLLRNNGADEVKVAGENGKNVYFFKKHEVGFLNISEEKGEEGCCSKMVMRECRICQEEDEENQLEIPCACSGTLKFAHRKCIQRWCNKKGDITCEICNKVFTPNYAFPPAKSSSHVMAIDIRDAWPHVDLHDTRFWEFTAAERRFLQSEYEDYAVASSGSVSCFRYVAMTLMLILIMRQALMVTREFEMLQESSTFFNLQVSLLQLAGFLLPCYVVARSWYIVRSRRRRQVRQNQVPSYKLHKF